MGSTFFDIVMYLKRYVGGLVVIDDWTSVYLVPRLLADDGINSFTVCRTSVSLETKYTNSLFRSFLPGRLDCHPFGDVSDVQRFNVKDRQ